MGPLVGPLPATGDVNVLFLSGGGSHGAWGAGVLHGWKDRPEGRPDFDLVTGISTGALQAPLVFLDRDADLETLYTETTTDQIYEVKPFLGIFSNSLQSREPLRQLIEDHLDDAAVKEVAEVADPNDDDVFDRHLWVGTVNLDTSQFCTWDLVRIAKAAQDAEEAGDAGKAGCYRDLFRDVVFAASGAPIAAPPVEIDGDHCETGGAKKGFLHVDGGTRLRVFAERVLLDQLRQTRATPGKPKAYVVMNGKMHMHPQCVDDRLVPIGVRALDILMNEAVFGNLYFLEKEMGNGWALRLSHIPHDYPLFSSAIFVPSQMQALFDDGSEWVQGSDPWGTSIPEARVKPCPADDASCACEG